jgi:hypothetical protein
VPFRSCQWRPGKNQLLERRVKWNPKLPSGPRLYLWLLALQTAGAALVLEKGVPIYRQMMAGPDQLPPHVGPLWWAIAAVALIQTGYWVRIWLQPPLPRGGHVVIGHVAGFVARVSFIFASSMFTVVFLLRFDQLPLPPHRVVMILLLLFSLYCWTLELERLARALHGHETKP